MATRYRRGLARSAAPAKLDEGDPYAQYLSWVADGRPTLASAAGDSGLIDGPIALAARPEESTVLLGEHVQVQERAASGGAESLLPRSRWQRLVDAIRGPGR
ncbi:hypothetical protein N1031_15760 [Herbiconiux moechotypicola]|uniref:DUF397 domain-containing protein n=1 Tax=Herbiconiux moechotypicola TaxID=637393 RepID=A0ABP5QXU2_9MICO|nr:hypothetical protein [Herbiconiux moechotypicola]MCS5731221.1 hypothetical protein [Herbiconiux moechotypicola]